MIKEAKRHRPQAANVLKKSEELLEKNLLDNADVEIVEKTMNILWTRWERLNDHLSERNDE